MPLTIHDFKGYLPAKDFEPSKRFYVALGFAMSEGWGATADFELNGHRFRLQNYYVKAWADNFMVVIGVDDIEAWHEQARKIVNSGEFDNIRIKPPEPVEDTIVQRLIPIRDREHHVVGKRGAHATSVIKPPPSS